MTYWQLAVASMAIMSGAGAGIGLVIHAITSRKSGSRFGND